MKEKKREKNYKNFAMKMSSGKQKKLQMLSRLGNTTKDVSVYTETPVG